MEGRRKHYVGVAAVRSELHKHWMLGCRQHLSDDQVLALGFHISEKTLQGELNKYPEIYPKIQELPGLLADRKQHANVEYHIHFSPNDGLELQSKLQTLDGYVGENADGLQVNYGWPHPEALWWWRNRRPDHRVILTLNRQALMDASGEPKFVTKHLHAEYDGLVTDILFDLSGGIGRALDADEALRFLTPLRMEFPELRLGVAGGLGPLSMQAVAELIPLLWPLSWDAQSRLCTKHGLDKTRAEVFVHLSGSLRHLALTE